MPETDPQSKRDPIPYIPLPHWVEEILVEAGRFILRGILARLISGIVLGNKPVEKTPGGPPDGSSNI